MILAVSDVVWLAGTIGMGLFVAAVTSAWNWYAIRRNRIEHSDIESRLGAVERILDHLIDRLFPFGDRDE